MTAGVVGSGVGLDLNETDVLNPMLRLRGIRSMLGVPLLVRREVIGEHSEQMREHGGRNSRYLDALPNATVAQSDVHSGYAGEACRRSPRVFASREEH